MMAGAVCVAGAVHMEGSEGVCPCATWHVKIIWSCQNTTTWSRAVL